MSQLSGQGPIGVHGPTTETWTSAANKVGTRAFDPDGNEYRFVGPFSAAVGSGGWVVIDGAWGADRVAATSRGAVGVAQTSQAASSYGWVKVYGVESAAQIGDSEATSAYGLIAPTGATTEPIMGVTSTMQTSVVSGAISNPVFGAWITAAASTGTTGSSSSFSGVTAQVFLNYPYLQGLTADRQGSS